MLKKAEIKMPNKDSAPDGAGQTANGTNPEIVPISPEVIPRAGRTKKAFKRLGLGFGVVFALEGFFFTAVFVAMQLGLLNVRGSIDSRNRFFTTLPKSEVNAATIPKKATATSCVEQGANAGAVPVCAWNQSEEWVTVRAGLQKDQAVINDVSNKTGVPSRLIASAVAPEQLRFFSSNRETYKKYFEPLKILGSMSQFSLGISGIKQETAKSIEQYTVDNNSPFYAGAGMAQLVAYQPGENRSSALYSRLTDSKNHYYSYLYTAIFIKEIEAQWKSQGYDINQRPDVIDTLFNIGFAQSHPKSSPQIGGTVITLSNTAYSYGELGTDFYMSDELTKVYPQP
jgi:hypothetical protein